MIKKPIEDNYACKKSGGLPVLAEIKGLLGLFLGGSARKDVSPLASKNRLKSAIITPVSSYKSVFICYMSKTRP